jgi:hypothetical protein
MASLHFDIAFSNPARNRHNTLAPKDVENERTD